MLARFSGVAWTLIPIGIGLVVIMLFGELSALTCARTGPRADRCTLHKQHGIRSTTKEFALAELRGAQVASTRSGGLTRMIVQTATEDIPFTTSHSSADSAPLAEAVQTFLATPDQATLSVVKDDRLVGYGVGGIVVIGGLVALVHQVRKLAAE